MNEKAIYALFPKKYRKAIEREAENANYKNHEKTAVYSFFIFTLGFLLAPLFLSVPLIFKIGLMCLGPLVSFFVTYSLLTLTAEKRKKEIEKVLPDALLLMSANIKSGLTVDKAFLLSARDEFGPLGKEIRKTAMKIFSGTSTKKALVELKEKTNSDMFEETIKLLIDGIKSGGELSSLLKSSAQDIRRNMSLRKEIKSNVRMYVMFISLAALVGAPLLFGLSNYLTETTAQSWGKQSIDMSKIGSQMIFKISNPNIKTNFFRKFSIVAIIIISGSSPFIISEIKNGNIKEGIKYMPFFIIIALSIYFSSKFVIQKLLGGMV